MYSISKRFNDMKMRQKLLISYIFVVLIPVLIIGIILSFELRNMALNDAVKEATTNVDRTETRIQQLLKVPTDISGRLFFDNKLQELLLTKYTSKYDLFMQYKSYDTLAGYVNAYDELANIRLYPFTKNMMENWNIMRLTPRITSSKWYREVMDNNGTMIWRYAYDETKKASFLSLIRVLRYNSVQNMGVLLIEVNNDALHSIIVNEPYKTILITDNGDVVLANDRKLEGKNIRRLKMFGAALHTNKKIIDSTYNNEPSKIIIKNFYADQSNELFKIISIFPVKNIVKNSDRISIVCLSIISLSLFSALILILIFTNIFGNRIKKLSVQMQAAMTSDFNMDMIPSIEGNDEIGQLSADLGVMFSNIKKLVYEVYDMDLHQKKLYIKQKDMQLKILINQINPHFMYNALETIRMKAYCRGEMDLAEIIKQFAIIMRRNLEASGEPVTLDSEMELVESYLQIQKFRFEDRINYKINIFADTTKYTILPFMLQPIVENAFVHGLENNDESGKIIITIEESLQFLIISVEDNGSGINEERLQEILKSFEDDSDDRGKRIGLRNVYNRIKLYYGDAYGMSISSRYGNGTKVTIKLPEVEVEKYV